MATCPICSTDNSDDATFCKQCGSNLPEPSLATATPSMVQDGWPQTTGGPGEARPSGGKETFSPFGGASHEYISPLPEAPDGIMAPSAFHVPANTAAGIRRAETSLRRKPAVIGAALGVLTSVLIVSIATPGGMLHQVFNLRQPEGFIPTVISALFFWAMAICYFRWKKVRCLEQLSRHSLVLELAQSVRATRSLASLAGLNTGAVETSPLLRRAQAVAQQWTAHPGLQDADVVLQQHVAHDEERVYASYSTVRTFVWALPVLGLIGTVLGISTAVGGFAQFLGGNIDDVMAIKKSLVGVTGGLSFAFLITLHGLLTSLLAMLTSSSLQTREQRLYATLQQGIIDVLLPALQEVVPPCGEVQPQPPDIDPEAWKTELMTASKAMLEQVSTVLKTYTAASVTTFTRGMDASKKAFGTAMEGVANAAVSTMEKVVTQATAKLEAVQQSQDHLVSEWRASIDNAIGGLRNGVLETRRVLEETQGRLTAQIEAEARHREENTKAIGEQTAGMRSAAESVATLAATTREVLEQHEALQRELQHLREHDIDGSVRALTEVLTTQAREMRRLGDAAAQLSSGLSTILESQGSLQEAMAHLHETGLAETLAGLREALTALAPVLDGFRGPFVFQAMPINVPGGRED